MKVLYVAEKQRRVFEATFLTMVIGDTKVPADSYDSILTIARTIRKFKEYASTVPMVPQGVSVIIKPLASEPCPQADASNPSDRCADAVCEHRQPPRPVRWAQWPEKDFEIQLEEAEYTVVKRCVDMVLVNASGGGRPFAAETVVEVLDYVNGAKAPDPEPTEPPA